jgi:hypothetical protein
MKYRKVSVLNPPQVWLRGIEWARSADNHVLRQVFKLEASQREERGKGGGR